MAHSQNNAIFGGGNSGGSFCNCVTNSGGIGPLPIELLTFEGLCDNNTILLQWSTASELNNNFYTIEASENGFDWQKSGNVDGSGTYSGILNYTYYASTYGRAITYYRLKQTDYDGKFEYSPVIAVAGCAVNDFFDVNIFPNPGTGIFKLSAIKYPENVSSIEIYNTYGIKLFETSTFQETIDISNFPVGIYEVRIRFGSITKSKKIILAK